MNEIEKNLYLINQKIKEVSKNYNKNCENVNLIAVSKKVEKEKIIQAINFGIKNFGENYIAEAYEKWVELKQNFTEIKLHLIGHLQTNKVKKALDLFDVIQSLDSEKLALEFQKEIAKKQEKDSDFKLPEFFVQVNIANEEQKSGIALEKTLEFVDFAKNKCGLNVVGLMCIPPENELASPYFALMNKLKNQSGLEKLSMGMSADYEQAIALNSDYIRLGTAIFGKRI